MQKTPQLVIFDCDGVLVDSEPLTNAVIAENLRGYGLDISGKEAQSRFVGGTMAGVAERIRDNGIALPDTWVDEIYAAIYQRLRQGVEKIEGIEPALTALTEAGIQICVASNGAEAKMDITLGQTGLIKHFEGRIFSAHTIGLHLAKPDPGLFLHAAKTMQADPRDCVVIEDSVTGATAAKAAGMRCFGYAADSDADGLRAQGAVIFNDMIQLPRMLGF
jgi:HAD superfamily hydrolase (TIGR01509 family)